MLGTARMLATSWALGFTGQIGPAKRASCRLAQHPVAQRLRVAAGADHRDAAGREQAPHGLGGGGARPRLDGRLGLGRRLQVEPHLDHAVGEAGGRLEPGLGEHPDHLPVVGQHRRGEPAEAHLPCPRREVLEEQRGQAAAVVGVVDEERHLRLGPVPPAVVARHADELVAAERDEREPVDVVDVGQALEVALREPRPRAEVPEVDALAATAARGTP